MGRTALIFVAGLGVGVSGWSLAQHGHGKGAAVKVLSAVDIEEVAGPKK